MDRAVVSARTSVVKTSAAKRREGGRAKKVISVVVPVFNEEEVLPAFHKRLISVLDKLPYLVEVIYVNDGSTDDSLMILRDLHAHDGRLAIINLSRNFGKELALTAGIDHAVGEAVVIIDADLQDPPEVIPELIEPWAEADYDVVYAQRLSRTGESSLKRGTAFAFYRVINWLSRVRVPPDTGDFRLLSRRAVQGLREVREHHRFMKGLFAWIGYRQIAVPYHRSPRASGRSKWNYVRLWNFSLEGITGFTIAPLKVATYVGLIVAISAIAYGGIIIWRTLIYGSEVPGYPSLMAVILLLGGLQLTTLGILGEYVGRVFNETKRRPLYLVQDVQAAEPGESAAAAPVPDDAREQRA
jgi:glycosyltransferase involved in cell wall biosynthesis